MRLVVAVDFRMQAGEVHQQRCPGAGMTKNKELLAWEELFDSATSSAVIAGMGLRFLLLGSPLSRMRAAVLKRDSMSGMTPYYFFQFNMIKPTRQTKIPRMLIHEILSLKRKIATGMRSSDATTLTNTAAIPRFQPER